MYVVGGEGWEREVGRGAGKVVGEEGQEVRGVWHR